MAREIDLTKPLSDEDAAYVSQRPWLAAEILLHEQNGELEYDLEEKSEAEEDEDETDETVDPYEDFKVADLKEVLESRGLSVSGNRAELVARLTEDDESEEDDDE